MCEKVRADLVEIYTGNPFPVKGMENSLMLLNNGRWRFFDEQFGGACGVGAYMLTILARRHNQTLVLAGHQAHFWCQTPEGTIVDPTYEQFDPRRPIHVGAPLKWHHGSEVDTRAKEILKRYPETQNPFSRYHRRTLERWMNTL